MHTRGRLAAVLTFTVFATAPALAQDFQFTSYNDIQAAYQAQNQEIALLRARLVALEEEAPVAAPEHGDAYGGCSAARGVRSVGTFRDPDVGIIAVG